METHSEASGWICVIPSIRTINLDYLSTLNRCDFAIIDDSNGSIPKTGWPSNFRVIDYDCRKKILGDSDNIVPRRSPSCKGVGIALAWKDGYSGIILADDDVDFRVTPDYAFRVPVGKQVMAKAGLEGDWVNTLQLLGEDRLYPRGHPYHFREGRQKELDDHDVECRPLFNEGLWCGVADCNGADKIKESVAKSGLSATGNERRCDSTVIVRKGQRIALSIMNVQFHRDIIPAFYQPPDYTLPSGWVIRRHDDVWSCLVLKSLMDLRGDVMTCGQPIGWHRKEGDMLKEAVAEHVTNLIQPYLVGLIDRSVAGMTPGSYAEMAIGLGERMRQNVYMVPGAYRDVLADYAERIVAWAKLFV